MAMIGVGIDVVDVERFGRTLERSPRLRERLFTPEEASLPLNSLAARFAAKEALAKALGAPAGLRWTDVTVRRPNGCAPELVISGTVAAAAAQLGVRRLLLSLSHDAGIASAVVVADDEARAAEAAAVTASGTGEQ